MARRQISRRAFALGATTLGATPVALGAAGEPDAPLRLVFGGDVCFTRDLAAGLAHDAALAPFAGLGSAWSDADLAFANLECVLCGPSVAPRPFRKGAPILRSPPEVAACLARGGADVVSLANNHVFDLGRAGLAETLAHLDRAGLPHVGAGLDRDAALAPLVIERRGLTLGLLAYTFGTNHVPDGGAAAARLRDEPVRHVRELRPRCDVLLVSLHWGDQFTSAIDASRVTLAHRLIDAGADALIGHHPHVLQAVEAYRGRPVFYSLGNFVWGLQDRAMPGALAELEVQRAEPRVRAARLLALRREKGRGFPTLIDARAGRRVLDEIALGSRRFRARFTRSERALELVL